MYLKLIYGLQCKERYSKLQEKRNALRQALKLLEQQLDKIQADNLRFKKGKSIYEYFVLFNFYLISDYAYPPVSKDEGYIFSFHPVKPAALGHLFSMSVCL